MKIGKVRILQAWTPATNWKQCTNALRELHKTNNSVSMMRQTQLDEYEAFKEICRFFSEAHERLADKLQWFKQNREKMKQNKFWNPSEEFLRNETRKGNGQ
jgi:hypothetical protein